MKVSPEEARKERVKVLVATSGLERKTNSTFYSWPTKSCDGLMVRKGEGVAVINFEFLNDENSIFPSVRMDSNRYADGRFLASAFGLPYVLVASINEGIVLVRTFKNKDGLNTPNIVLEFGDTILVHIPKESFKCL